jgi:hypothetical protein
MSGNDVSAGNGNANRPAAGGRTPATGPASDQLRLGFLDTLEVDGRGYVGGLLITNQNGRPLEFQCTTPVKPNRTQEILFGEALRPWLLAELIGVTLLDRVGIKPDIVITGDSTLLELRNHTSIPVAHASEESSDNSPTRSTTRAVTVGKRQLRFHDAHAVDAERLQQQRHLIPETADVGEPLERVREALAETVRTVFTR